MFQRTKTSRKPVGSGSSDRPSHEYSTQSTQFAASPYVNARGSPKPTDSPSFKRDSSGSEEFFDTQANLSDARNILARQAIPENSLPENNHQRAARDSTASFMTTTTTTSTYPPPVRAVSSRGASSTSAHSPITSASLMPAQSFHNTGTNPEPPSLRTTPMLNTETNSRKSSDAKQKIGSPPSEAARTGPPIDPSKLGISLNSTKRNSAKSAVPPKRTTSEGSTSSSEQTKPLESKAGPLLNKKSLTALLPKSPKKPAKSPQATPAPSLPAAAKSATKSAAKSAPAPTPQGPQSTKSETKSARNEEPKPSKPALAVATSSAPSLAKPVTSSAPPLSYQNQPLASPLTSPSLSSASPTVARFPSTSTRPSSTSSNVPYSIRNPTASVTSVASSVPPVPTASKDASTSKTIGGSTPNSDSGIAGALQSTRDSEALDEQDKKRSSSSSSATETMTSTNPFYSAENSTASFPNQSGTSFPNQSGSFSYNQDDSSYINASTDFYAGGNYYDSNYQFYPQQYGSQAYYEQYGSQPAKQDQSQESFQQSQESFQQSQDSFQQSQDSFQKGQDSFQQGQFQSQEQFQQYPEAYAYQEGYADQYVYNYGNYYGDQWSAQQWATPFVNQSEQSLPYSVDSSSAAATERVPTDSSSNVAPSSALPSTAASQEASEPTAAPYERPIVPLKMPEPSPFENEPESEGFARAPGRRDASLRLNGLAAVDSNEVNERGNERASGVSAKGSARTSFNAGSTSPTAHGNGSASEISPRTSRSRHETPHADSPHADSPPPYTSPVLDRKSPASNRRRSGSTTRSTHQNQDLGIGKGSSYVRRIRAEAGETQTSRQPASLPLGLRRTKQKQPVYVKPEFLRRAMDIRYTHLPQRMLETEVDDYEDEIVPGKEHSVPATPDPPSRSSSPTDSIVEQTGKLKLFVANPDDDD